MKDILIWHYLTIRSDYLQVGDYYYFSGDGKNDIILIQGSKVKYGYLIKLSVSEIVLMRLKEKKKQYVWQVVKKSQRKKNNHHRVQGKLIRNLSKVDL